jgi:hypothetical protein
VQRRSTFDPEVAPVTSVGRQGFSSDVILPHERNAMLNPRHPAVRIRIEERAPLGFDPRLFGDAP